MAQAKRYFFLREDEVHGLSGDGEVKEYGVRQFIPASLPNSAEYLGEVVTKCFALSTQFGVPTFFLPFTMNLYLLEFMALKRGEGTFSDSAMATIGFPLKLNALVQKIKAEKSLGSVLAFVWRIEYQRRGLPHARLLFWSDCDTTDVAAIDKIVNVRFPRTSPLCHEHNLVADFRTLIKTYQIHNHSKRCAGEKGRCKFGYPQPISSGTVLRGH
jgi:hypothetical protein